MLNRAVVLGASNVSIGYRTICRLLLNSSEDPLEIFTASGHGRSYGLWSRFLFRGLPGITQSGLWDRLQLEMEVKEHTRISGLLTDIGNDLIYGVEVDQILEWVQDCLDRLTQLEASITVTELPMEPLLKLSSARYEMTRRIFFRGKSLPWKEMKSRIISLNENLLRLTGDYDIRMVKPKPEWYGFDPIHMKWGSRAQAWKEILGCDGLNSSQVPSGVITSLSRNRGKRWERSVRNSLKRTEQPVFQSDQVTLYSY